MINFLLSGFFPLPWWGYAVFLLICTQFTIMSVTIFLHRCQAHRAVTLHPVVSHFFRLWLWLGTGIETKQWTAIHRKHHAKVETSEDPHSPIVRGIKKVFFEGAELYREESAKQETMDRYGSGTPDDWLERHVYSRYSTLGITLLFVINFLLFGVIGITFWAVQMAWIPFFAAGVVNGIGHYWGYRNYEVSDASRNIFPIGFFIGGEELHNNHHAFGTSAKFSTRWFEFDMGWFVIRALQMLGLAQPKNVVVQPKRELSKTSIDADTVKALITHRFQLMAHYTRQVILPMLRYERKRAGKTDGDVLRHANTVLVRDVSIMKPVQKTRLFHILEQFQTLKVVYQLRVKLQDIWSQSAASQKELIEAIQMWCQQAEATRIEPVLQFVKYLKTYTSRQVQPS